MYCPKCGHKNEDSAAFCGGCGKALTATAPASPWRPAGDIPGKARRTLPETPARPEYTPPAGEEQKTESTAVAHAAEKKRRSRVCRVLLPVGAAVCVLIAAFFAVRATQPWFSVDNGRLCFHETLWNIFDFGYFQDTLTLPHDSDGWNGRIDSELSRQMSRFREFEYSGTAQELCLNNPWVLYCLSEQNYGVIRCKDLDIVRMDGGMVRISDDSPYNQKVISYDPFSGEYREYDAGFIEAAFVVLEKDDDALCGFDSVADLLYWAETGIARTIHSDWGY